MKKRWLIFLFVVIFLIPPITVHAEPALNPIDLNAGNNVRGMDDLVQQLRANMAELSSSAIMLSQTSEGKLYELTLLANMVKSLYYLSNITVTVPLRDESWPDFEYNLEWHGGVSDTEFLEIARSVSVFASNFTNIHGIDPELLLFLPDYDPYVELSRDAIRERLEEILQQNIFNIVESELAPVLEAASLVNDGNYNFIVSRYSELLYWTGEIIDVLLSFEEDFHDIRIQNDHLNDRLLAWFLAIFEFDTSYILNIIYNDARFNRVRLLVTEARNARITIPFVGGGASVPENIQFLAEALATVRRRQGWNERDFSALAWEPAPGSDQINLTTAYAAMVAATAVYMPFRSHVGDSDYIEALRFLTDAGEEDRILTLFGLIKNKRKPLYFMSRESIGTVITNQWGSSYQDLRGRAYRATLGDMIRFAENGDNTIFLTVRGQFSTGPDMGVWAFRQPSQLEGVMLGMESSSMEGTADIVIPAERSITGDMFTRALFEMGDAPGVYSAGLLLFGNAFRDLRNTAALERRRNSILYMNVFGDIVLDDNLVIIPGASNPLIYNPARAYNPYTVAFMNSYPRLAQDATTLRVQNATDFNKHMLFISQDVWNSIGSLFAFSFFGNNIVFTEDLVREVIEYNIFGYINLEIRKIPAADEFVPGNRRRGIPIFPFFYGGGDGRVTNWYSFLRIGYTDNVGGHNLFGEIRHLLTGEMAVVFEQTLTNQNFTLFPYSPDENHPDFLGQAVDPNSMYMAPRLIAQNMFWYFMHDPATLSMGTTPNDVLRADFIFENIIVEMLQGVEYVSAFERNIELTDFLLNDGQDDSLNELIGFAQSFMDNVGGMDGVLGMRSADADPIFGSVLQVTRRYAMYLFIVILAIFVFRYMKRGDFLYVATMSTISGFFVYLFIFIMPTYLPILYNSVGNVFTDRLVSHTVLYKTERFSTTYGVANQLNVQSNYDVQTVSITIYRMSEAALRRFSEDYGVPLEAFRYGGRVVIDPRIGLFIQGDSLKINIDVLFLNHRITGRLVPGTHIHQYQLFSEKLTSSSLDFFIPYFLIADGFVDTLNALLRAYTIPRTTANYVDGLIKDAFVVFNYTNSIPFLYGEDFHLVYGLTPIEMFRLQEFFPNPTDFLNLSEWIHNPTSQMQSTLWYRTMLRNGFYDPVLGEHRRNRLIEYVNNRTKAFLIENQSIIGFVSDQSLIKVTAMQALFHFNSHISEIGMWAFPLGYNQEELNLNDVFLTALTTHGERFVHHHFDLVIYIANNYGVVGLRFFIAIMFFAVLFVVLAQFSMPVLYLLLGIFVLYSLVLDKPVMDLLKGYFKITFAIIGIYTSFIITLAWVPAFISGMTMLVALAIINLLLLFTMVIVILGFLADISNFGNYGIGEALVGNPITGLFAMPVRKIFTTSQRILSENALGARAEDEGASSNEDIVASNRRYIIDSMEQHQTSASPVNIREPQVTYSNFT